VREAHELAEGLGLPESTRWRDGRVWLCNCGTGEVQAVATGGQRRVIGPGSTGQLLAAPGQPAPHAGRP